MPTFGFSAFLKLICLNDRPSRTQLRSRLQPSEGGYDFHRSLRQRAQRYLMYGETMEEVVASIGDIVRVAMKRLPGETAPSREVELMAHLLMGAVMEAAIICATAEDPEAAARDLSSALRHMLLGA